MTQDNSSENQMISIITATYNAAQHLPRLIASLRAQTNKDLEWVVADGGSTDGTIDLLKEVKDLEVVIDSRPDFGIYDALNRAIKLSSGEYYLVLGADDILYDDAIDNFIKSILHKECDIVSAQIVCNGKILSAKKKLKWLYGQNYYISMHAVGCLIKKDLHDKFGFYSHLYPIGADFLFLKRIGDAGCRIYHVDFISGEFGANGLSRTDILASLADVYRAQIQTGECKLVQTLLFMLRIMKNWRQF